MQCSWTAGFVELLRLAACMSHASNPAVLCCVLQETVRILKDRACAAFGVEPDKVEIWDYFNHGKYANIDKELDKDLETARILDEQPILLDDKVGSCGSVLGTAARVVGDCVGISGLTRMGGSTHIGRAADRAALQGVQATRVHMVVRGKKYDSGLQCQPAAY
jgi:hypothetical protein